MNTMKLTISLTTLALMTLAGCTGDPGAGQNNEALRKTLDEATISLADSVTIAEGSLAGGAARKATLLTKSKLVSVGALANGSLQDVRIDLGGSVVSTQAVEGAATPSCEGAVGLGAVIAAAEDAVDGEAVTVIPDDDDACDREVKVLDGDDVLWEVKIAPDGSVKETEVADDADETDG